MLTTATHTQPHVVLPTTSTYPQPSVLKEQSLSPQEIERICRCFIRLIKAAEEVYNAEQPTFPQAERV